MREIQRWLLIVLCFALLLGHSEIKINVDLSWAFLGMVLFILLTSLSIIQQQNGGLKRGTLFLVKDVSYYGSSWTFGYYLLGLILFCWSIIGLLQPAEIAGNTITNWLSNNFHDTNYFVAKPVTWQFYTAVFILGIISFLMAKSKGKVVFVFNGTHLDVIRQGRQLHRIDFQQVTPEMTVTNSFILIDEKTGQKDLYNIPHLRLSDEEVEAFVRWWRQFS